MARKGRKGKRKQRRPAEREAASVGDIAVLARTRPREAAQRLTKQLRKTPLSAELEPLALELAARLRKRGDYREARQLAEAGMAQSRRLRLAAALAAFAASDDAGAAALVKDDEEVERVLAPLLAAAQGALPAGASKGTPKRLVALTAVATATAWARRGELEAARKALRRIPKRQHEGLSLPAMRAAVTLAATPAVQALRRAMTMLCKTDEIMLEEVAAAALLELARRLPHDAFALAEREVDISDETELRLALIGELDAPGAAWEAAGKDAALVLRLAGSFGMRPFVAEDGAVALLYVGFANVLTNPDEANTAFEEAIGEGADLVEAYRGKAMVARQLMRVSWDAKRAGRAAAVAALRLARVLEKYPSAAPLTLSAATDAVLMAFECDDDKLAQQGLKLARAHSQLADADKLDLLEVEALLENSAFPAAIALLDEVLQRSPDNKRAWSIKIELASLAGDSAESLALAEQAAAATGDEKLNQDLMVRRISSDEVDVEETSPGMMVLALARLALAATVKAPSIVGRGAAGGGAAGGRADAPSVLVAALRERASRLTAWGGDEQLAVYLGALCAARVHDGDITPLLAYVVKACGDDTRRLEAIAEGLGWLGYDQVLADQLVPLELATTSSAAVALLRGLVSAGCQDAARRMLRKVVVVLEAASVTRCLNAVHRHHDGTLKYLPMLAATLRPAADLFQLKGVVEEIAQRRQDGEEDFGVPFGGADEFDDEELDDDDLVFVDPKPGSGLGVPSLEEMLARYGFDASTMPPGLRAEMEELLANITHPAELEMLLNMFNMNMGGPGTRQPTGGGAGSSNKSKEQRKKQAQKRKQRRRQRKRK